MGYPIIRYICSSCGRKEHGGGSHKPQYYRLDDGSYISLNWCYGWCFSCDGLRTIEDVAMDDHVRAIRRISHSLASATPRWRWFSRTWDCESHHFLDVGLSASREMDKEDFQGMADTLEEAGKQIEYLAARVEPARCLKCGGQEVERLTPIVHGESRGWPHPGCDGTLVMEYVGSMNLVPSKTRLVYKPNGEFSHTEPEPPAAIHPKFTSTAD